MDPHYCTADNAAKFLDWIQNRGGVAVWKSIDLSNPGKSWSTPATVKVSDCEGTDKITGIRKCPKCFNVFQSHEENYTCANCGHQCGDLDCVVAYPKLQWQMESSPSRVITDPKEILVAIDKEVKRFHVGVRRSGLGFKCTDASSRKIREAVEAAGKGAYHEFDYETQEAVIMAPEKTMTLDEWAASQKAT